MYSLGKQTDNFSKFIGHLYLNIGIYKSLTIIDYSLYLWVSFILPPPSLPREMWY